MDNLKAMILMGLSKTLLQRSPTFRDNLSQFLLRRNLNDLNHADRLLLNRMTEELLQNLEEKPPNLTNNLSNVLIGIFNQPDWLTLTRVLQTMHRLPTGYPVDQARLSMYLEQLKFKENLLIDLKEFSKAICNKYDPVGIKIFRKLTQQQKNIIELLNQEQMEALANFRSKSIGFLSRIMHIDPDQRSIILSLTEAGIRMYKKIGSNNIDELLEMSAEHLNVILTVGQRDRAELPSLCTRFPGIKSHILRVAKYTPGKMRTLKKLVRHPRLRELRVEGKVFITSNEPILEQDIQEFERRNDGQKDIIRNLNEEMRNALGEFDVHGRTVTLRNVLKKAIELGVESKDLIVLLTKDQLDSMIEGSGDEDLTDIGNLNTVGRSYMMELDNFPNDEDTELFSNIDQGQRKVLSKLYALCPDALEIIKELGPERTYETLARIRADPRELGNFDIQQQILTKRIQRLGEDERRAILELTAAELTSFNRIFSLGSDSIHYLTNLSREGLIVLHSVRDYTADQIQFVRDLTTQGMGVLARNRQLNPTIIESLRQMTHDKSKLLLNLNLLQRVHLGAYGIEEYQPLHLFNQQEIDILRNLSPQERVLLSTIYALTGHEVTRLYGVNQNDLIAIDVIDPFISRLFFILREPEIEKVANSFHWRLEEKFAFGLWKSLLDPTPGDPTIDNFLETIKSPILRDEYRGEYLKFIAGVVMAYRSAEPQESVIVENMATAIETIYRGSSKVEFYVHLLNYSIEDEVESNKLKDLFSKIPDTEFSRQKLRELCEISHGDVPFLFRWMLVNPIEEHQELSNRLTREILTTHALNPNPETLNTILGDYRGIQGYDIMQSLRTLLTDSDYSLTHMFFFNPQKDFKKWRSITEWLSKCLTPSQQYEFLNSPVNHVQESSMSVLEHSLYSDEGCPHPFFEHLDSVRIQLLFNAHPVMILRAIVRNGHFRTLQIFNRAVGKSRLMGLMRDNRQEIFLSNEEGFIFGNHRLKELAQTVQWFAGEDPDPSFYVPIKTQLSLEARALSDAEYDHIMDILGNPLQIANEVRRRQPPLDGPSCAGRRRLERSLVPVCTDSTEKEEMNVDEKEHLMRSVFGNMQPEHNDLYQLMMSAHNEANLEKLSEKVANLHLDSVDSDIRDVLRDIKNVGKDKEKVAEILSGSNAATRIQKVAERAGLGFTLFLVFKHLAHWDFKSLGWDTLNIWALPKLGSKVTEKLLSMSTRLNPRVMRVIAPALGRAIGNFGAFLGLAESIKARKDAQDPLDIEIANINIISNSVFILADIPALVTDVLGSFEVATGVIGEFAGPFGTSVSVAVIVLAESIKVALEVNSVSKELQLTLLQDVGVFFETVWDGQLPDDILRDATVERTYHDHLSKIINDYRNEYGMIAISLPPILMTTGRYCEATNFIKTFFHDPCNINTTTTEIKFDLSLDTVTRDPFTKIHVGPFSRSVPPNIQGYNLVCGPREDDARSEQVRFEPILSEVEASHQSKGSGKDILIDLTTEKLYIPPQNNADCDNIVLYKNQTSRAFERVLFHATQNASISVPKGQPMDVIFAGTNLFLFDHGIDDPSPPRSKFIFLRKLNQCTIHKEGLNLLVIQYNGTFDCNLGGESRRQMNVAMVQGNFTDIENIHRIVGSEISDHINVTYSAHVDGQGGNDTIYAQNATVVRSYYGDVIHGKTSTQLPMNVSEIHRIVADQFITVYNGKNQSIQVDAGSVLQTDDEFLIYPMKTNNETHMVTHLYIHKNVDGDIVLEDELAILGQLKTLPFNSSKLITSWNYDIASSDNDHSMFHADRNNHNFYWEAADGKDHHYIFEFIIANVTISNAKGVIDFSKFNHVFEDSKHNLAISEPKQNGAPLTIEIGGLRVNLLANRQPIKVTFDGETYYDIKNARLERDDCPYSFKVDGRLIVDGQELFNHHNCFKFPSDKIIFYKQNPHLFLSSGRNVLTITNFYPLVHENLDVSLKLNSRVMGPKEFRKKASNPDPFRFYEIIQPGLLIHHNLPIDKDQIGVIHTNHTSILDHDIEFQGDDLLLTNRNGISVTVVDWKKYQAAREVMFAFNDTLILNAQCVSSTCTPEFILEEFQRQKQLIKPSPIRRKRNVHPDSLEITGNSTYPLNNTFSAFKDNVNLLLLFVQNFLDNKYPLPQFPSINPEEVCAYATNITQSFKTKLTETGQNYGITLKDFDCFELYTNITEHLKNEEYSKATKILNSVVEGAFQHTA